MEPSKAETVLIQLNGIVAQFIPLLAVVSPIAQTIAGLLRRNGQPAEALAFEAKMKEWENERVNLAAAIDNFHQKYPVVPTPPVQ